MFWVIVTSLVLSVGFFGCSPGYDEYVDLVTALQECTPEDVCVRPPHTECGCAPNPVPEQHVPQIQTLVDDMDCGTMQADCLYPPDARCSDGLCKFVYPSEAEDASSRLPTW